MRRHVLQPCASLVCIGMHSTALPASSPAYRPSMPTPSSPCCHFRAGPFTIDLRRCSFCDSRADGSPLGSLLYCVVCRPGTVPVGDRYRQVTLAMCSC